MYGYVCVSLSLCICICIYVCICIRICISIWIYICICICIYIYIDAHTYYTNKQTHTRRISTQVSSETMTLRQRRPSARFRMRIDLF